MLPSGVWKDAIDSLRKSMISTLSPSRHRPSEPEAESLPHVLIILDQLSRTMGGGERIALQVAELLPCYGFRASVLTFFADSQSQAILSSAPIYVLPLKRTYDLTALHAAFELRRFIQQQHVRIVHTFFESSDLWAGFVTKTLTDAKLVWSRRDMGILRSPRHHVAYRLMAGLPDAVFAVSEQVRRHCTQVDGISPARVQTIYNGLPLADWVPAAKTALPSGRFHVTTVGNIRHVKGHDVFIKAAALVVSSFPDVSFSIAGEVLEPEYFEDLKALVHHLNLGDQFSFHGGVTNLRQHFASVDIFVLPSRSEGFSNALVEAMASSLPIIATDVGGNAEAVRDGISGLMIPSDDPAALSRAMLQLLLDPPLAAKMGAAGRAIAEERFTTEAMMRKIRRAFMDILAAR